MVGGGGVSIDQVAWRIGRLAPVLPLFAWLEGLEPGLAGAVVLDLSGLALHGPGVRALVGELAGRGIRVVGLAGVREEALGPEAGRLPPVLVLEEAGLAEGGVCEAAAAAPVAVPMEAARSLTVERTLRSGQSVIHAGDVTVIGSVSSGAEVNARGSIHVLGTLHGRALVAEPSGRIFCRRMEAELVSIGGVFATADDISADLVGQAVCVWLDDAVLRFVRI